MYVLWIGFEQGRRQTSFENPSFAKFSLLSHRWPQLRASQISNNFEVGRQIRASPKKLAKLATWLKAWLTSWGD